MTKSSYKIPKYICACLFEFTKSVAADHMPTMCVPCRHGESCSVLAVTTFLSARELYAERFCL